MKNMKTVFILQLLYTGCMVYSSPVDVQDEVEVESVTEIPEEKEIPRITYSKDMTTKQGDNVTLFCGVEGVPFDQAKNFLVSWSKSDLKKPADSLPISRGEDLVLLSDKYEISPVENSYKYKLTINNMQISDAGIYQCSVNFGQDPTGREQKVFANVSVNIESPAFFLDDYTKVLRVTEGDSISIDCQPGGYPKPEVYWERSDKNLPFLERNLFKANRLDIQQIVRDHKGSYVCHADNGIGDAATSEVILEVQFKPDIAVEESMIYAQNSQKVSITCATRAFPEPDISWYKDEKIILSSNNARVRKEKIKKDDEHDQINLILTLDSPREEDYGKYVCKSSNVVGTSEASANVTMKTPPSIVRQTDTDILFDFGLTLSRNNLPLALECQADGSPMPEYKWRKNGAPLIWQTDKRFSLEEGTGNLLIETPVPTDSGEYQCIAVNEMGSAISNPIKVTPEQGIQFTRIQDTDMYTVEAEAGRPFVLTCPEATGTPKPNLMWMKSRNNNNGTSSIQIIDGQRVVSHNGSLFFTVVEAEDDTDSSGFSFICVGYHDSEPQDLRLGVTVNLKVIGSINETSVAEGYVEPFLMFKSNKTSSMSGEILELWCIYGGAPNPEVLWYKDGEIINKENNKNIQFKNNGKTLEFFQGMTKDDIGSYNCASINAIGNQNNNTFNITVKEKPFIKTPIATHTVQKGENITLNCSVHNPDYEMEYEWTFNGRPLEYFDSIENKSRKAIHADYIFINNIGNTHIGNYGCKGIYSEGYVSGQILVNVLSESMSTREDLSSIANDVILTEINHLKESIQDIKKLINQQSIKQDQSLNNILQLITKALPSQ